MKNLNEYPVMKPVFEIKEAEADEHSATLVIEPLEQGYGHTLGNALRRVLLTSLPGSAISKVRIEGADHEYTTLEGMKEDVVELILNLKQVRLKTTTSDEEQIISLSVSGPAEVTAADFDLESGVEIVDPDQYLATLTKGNKLNLEATITSGIGYSMAQEREANVIGEVPVDALYSPVTQVSYEVEQTRVGRRTDYDKIVMQLKTDGTIAPKEAVETAARILHRQFEQVFEPVVPEPKEEGPKLTPEEAETLRLTVEELDLPTRIANALRKGGFKTVADLKQTPRSTITKVKNLGEKSVEIIADALAKKDISLSEDEE